MKPPTLAGTIGTICRSPFTTGGSGKEHGTNKSPPKRRVQERSEGDTMCPTTSQNPRWHPPWLSDACATRKDSESESLAKYNPETNNNTLDCKPQGRAVLPGSFNTPALPGCPFPVKALALSAHVSPQTIRFLALDKTHFWALEGVPLPATDGQATGGSQPTWSGETESPARGAQQ